MSSRIETAFANAKAQGRGILGVFVTAGDPDEGTSAQILDALVEANVDIVELGMPFSDPMADGPAIQAASLRALKNGMTLAGTLEIARGFRQRHPDTPLVLMGYYNPIYIYGVDRFLAEASEGGSSIGESRRSAAAAPAPTAHSLSTSSCDGRGST